MAVRTAFVRHGILASTLRVLNNFVSKIRKTIELSKLFRTYKCKLRLENATRWGSAYLLLELIKKANDRGVFEKADISLPVSIGLIEKYLVILKPLYILNIGFQSNRSTIADVIPSLLKLINSLEMMESKSTETPKRLCSLLISSIKERFDYELNSKYYQVF